MMRPTIIAPPNKRMQRTKRHSGVGRRAPRAVVANLRFAADPRRSADNWWTRRQPRRILGAGTDDA